MDSILLSNLFRPLFSQKGLLRTEVNNSWFVLCYKPDLILPSTFVPPSDHSVEYALSIGSGTIID